MAIATTGFKWLDILEKEFDKAFVDLDLIFGELDDDESQLVKMGRERLASISSCFSQLTHKAQTVFQTNAKLEAELVNLRAELSLAHGMKQGAEAALEEAVRQLHAALLQIHSLQNNDDDATDLIRKKLESEIFEKQKDKTEECDMLFKLKLLEEENERWKTYVTNLHSDIYGARLAAKYLEKELAGRIQQMQLLGREMRPDLRDKLWDQLEAEIHLHRHKVIIRACQNHSKKNASNRSRNLHRSKAAGEIRTVVVRKKSDEGMGMSITGGRDHGVPVVISEIHDDGPAMACGELNIGDAILEVNGVDLKQVLHEEAVEILSSQEGDVTLRVQFISPSPGDSDDEDSQHIRHFHYHYFPEDAPSVSSQTNESAESLQK